MTYFHTYEDMPKPRKVFHLTSGYGDLPGEMMSYPAQARLRLGFGPGIWLVQRKSYPWGWRRIWLGSWLGWKP